MRYAFIKAHRIEFSIRAMCRVLVVHFSGFYAWLKEPLSSRAHEDVRQTDLIRQAWADSGMMICAMLAKPALRTVWHGWPTWRGLQRRLAINAALVDMVASRRSLLTTRWIDSSKSMYPTEYG